MRERKPLKQVTNDEFMRVARWIIEQAVDGNTEPFWLILEAAVGKVPPPLSVENLGRDVCQLRQRIDAICPPTARKETKTPKPM